MTLRRITALALVALALQAPSASAEHDRGAYRRAYLLADQSERLFWSFDAAEPGADVRTVIRRCPDQPRITGTPPCRGAASAAGHPLTLWFARRSMLADTVEWTPATKPRFRFALEVDTAFPYSVQVAYADTGGAVFGPASEVSPGIWEGNLPSRTSIDPLADIEFGVRVTLSPTGTSLVTLRTDGSSYLEFPEPVEGWSLAQLQRRSPDPDQPRSFASTLRTLTFNDDRWRGFSFQGDLGEQREFTVPVPEPAAWAIGWVEVYREPWVHDLIRRRQVSPERLTDTPRARFVRGGQVLSYGYNLEDEQTGRGTDMTTVMALEPGDLTLRVIPSDYAQGATYAAHVVIGYGERTLRSIRSRFTPNTFFFLPNGNVGGVQVCPGNAEGVPLSSVVSAVRIDVDWDSVNPLTTWGPRYSRSGGRDIPCGWEGSGPAVTLVDRGRVLNFGATPAYDSPSVVYRDTVIDAEVRLWYEPPPHEEEAAAP